MSEPTPDILNKILQRKGEEIKERSARVPLDEQLRRAETQDAPEDLSRA